MMAYWRVLRQSSDSKSQDKLCALTATVRLEVV